MSEDTQSPTFGTLRAQNLEALQSWRSATKDDGSKDEEAIDAVTRFTKAVVVAGEHLAAESERNAAQEMLDYWSTQLLSANASAATIVWPPIRPYVGGDIPESAREATAATHPTLSAPVESDKLHIARQEIRLSALARQWDKSDRAPGYLLSGSALRTAAPYANSNDKVLADFVKAGLRRAARRTRAAELVAAAVLATLVIAIGIGVYLYNTVQQLADQKILSIADPQSTPSDNADRLRWLSRYHRALTPQDLSGMAFHDLQVDNLSLVAANFTASIFKNVSFRNGNLSRTSFIMSKILLDNPKPGGTSDFGGSNLRLAQFQGATIRDTSFAKADLYRASFNDTKIRNVDFSEALLRSAYLMSADIDTDFNTSFKNTGWWLSPFWSWMDLKKLRELPVDEANLKGSSAFCRDFRMSEQRLAASTPGAFDRARTLNGVAWTLATWGLYLAPGERNEKAGEKCDDYTWSARLPGNAYEAARDAIAICSKPGQSRNQEEQARYESDLANYRGTYALVLMQLDEKKTEAFDILSKIPDDEIDSDTLFLYALLQYDRGDQANGRRAMHDALEEGYFPSHEFHVLKKYIKGDLKKDLDLFVCTKRPTRNKQVDCAAEATR